VVVVRRRSRLALSRCALIGTSAIVAASAAILAATNSAHAQSTWLGGSANYRQAGNWSPATPPVAAGQSAIFGNSGSTTVNITTAPGPISPDSWTFTTNAQNYTFTGADVNFSVAGSFGGIISSANAGQLITIKNNIGASVPGVNVKVLGNSTLFLTAANTYGGGTIVDGGTIQAAKDTSFGTGLITLDKGTLMGDGVHNLNIGNLVGVNNVLGPTSTVDNAGKKLTLSGDILGAGGLVFIDSSPGAPFAGKTVLSGTNGYSGGTKIVATTVQANNASVFGSGSVTLDFGTVATKGSNLTLTNDFILANTINIGGVTGGFLDANGATLRISGNITGAGALEIADSTLGSNSVILTGTNSYTGGTTVCFCATLQIGTASTLGSIIGTIDNLGTLKFVNADNSGITTLKNEGGALTSFQNATSAGTMTIENLFDPFFGPSTLRFRDSASAGNATINNHADASSPFGSLVVFSESATAGKSTISNGDSASLGSATIKFNDDSTAGQAKINNFGFGSVTFSDQATAGFATINNNDAGILTFKNHSSADNATIVNNADGSLGGVAFTNHSTAGNAFITTNNGALTLFSDHSDGGTARFVANAGSTVDFSQTSGLAADGKINVGSFAGAGAYYLGGNQVTVGGNNLSGVVDGTINDGVSPALLLASCGCGLTFNTGASLVKAGTGTLTLNGVNTYTGPTTVDDGKLIVNGSIASSSALTVNAGGAVGGNGSLPKTTINGGTLSPGNSIGTISIGGSLAFVGAGNYIVEVSPSAADKTNVTGAPGTASLAGTLSAVGTGGIYAVGSKYTVLNATGGVSGTFSGLSVSGSFGVTKPHVEYDANNVYLVLDLNAISSFLVGATPNQKAVAGAIDAALTAGSQSAPFLALYGLTAAQLPGALDQLSGEVHPSTAGVLLDESLYPRSAVLGRLRQASYGGDSGMASLSAGGPQAFANGEELSALAYAKSPIVTKAPPMSSQPGYDVVFWAQGFGASGKFDTDGNAAAVRRDLAGFFSGADTRVGTNGRLGFAAGYTGSRNNLDGRGGSSVETAHISGYGGWSFGALNLRGGAAYAWHTIDTSRNIAFPGFFDNATAHYNGGTGQIFGEAGYGFAFGKVAVEPFAGAALVRLNTDAFNERGGAAALAVRANTFEVGYSTFGVRAASMIPLANDMMLMPRASLAWQHAFNDVTPTDTLAFQSAGVPFVIAGVPIARDSALGEAGLDLAIGRNATLGVSYVGQLARNVHDHAAKGRFTWKF